MEIPFTKLQGNGNDFILVDEYIATVIPDELKAQFAACYCDRRYGVGADGVLFLSRTDKGNLKMRILQPDESEAEMCGNGIRCFAKYAFDEGYADASCMVETMAGEIRVSMRYKKGDFSATISMPEPKFDRQEIPASGKGEYREKIGKFEVLAANVGVPHAVIVVDSVAKIDVEDAAPAIRNHKSFKKGANVNFVEKTGENRIRIRTFERGIEGETLSCGTGATASAAIMHRLGLVGEAVDVETSGGPLVIQLGETVKMKGPAVTVFKGYIRF